jgi:hypothetical protein
MQQEIASIMLRTRANAPTICYRKGTASQSTGAGMLCRRLLFRICSIGSYMLVVCSYVALVHLSDERP